MLSGSYSNLLSPPTSHDLPARHIETVSVMVSLGLKIVVGSGVNVGSDVSKNGHKKQ